MTSIILNFSGNSSTLTSYFHPEIKLDDNFNYSCALLDLYTYNSIPNVTKGNNRFHYRRKTDSQLYHVEIPVGSYELDDIGEFLKEYFQRNDSSFHLQGNRNIMKCIIKKEADLDINFEKNGTIGSLLGFNKRILSGGGIHSSDNIVNINPIDSIKIDCDLISGSFKNGNSVHTLYEFTPSVNPGYKIREQPRHLIYLPVVRKRINSINISIVDQNGKLVDFRGEQITCRLHIKRES